MPDSPVFSAVCDELERLGSLERLATRGTVRIAVKQAGLDVANVDAAQMAIVLMRVLPGELASRGVDDGQRICQEIARTLASRRFEVAPDRASEAAATIGRFGS